MSYSILKKDKFSKEDVNESKNQPSMFEHSFENKEIVLQTIYKLHLMLIDHLEIQ